MKRSSVRPSVRPSVLSFDRSSGACSRFAADRQKISIDNGRLRAPNSKCGQCRVHSRGKRLNRDVS